jgi:hypothetical protein
MQGLVKFRVILGLVLDSKLGLIVTDRNAVPTSIGDVLLTFANSIIIPAQVLYLHQVYNYAIVKYDPKLLGATDVKDAIISNVSLRQNDSGIISVFNVSIPGMYVKVLSANGS